MTAYVRLSLVSSQFHETPRLGGSRAVAPSALKPQLGKDPCCFFGPGTSAGNLGAAEAGASYICQMEPFTLLGLTVWFSDVIRAGGG